MPGRKTRNKSKKRQNENYKATNRKEVNKKLKIERHQKKHPNDQTVIGTKPDYKRKNNENTRREKSVAKANGK